MKRLSPLQLMAINIITTCVFMVIGGMILSSWQFEKETIQGAASVDYVDQENCNQNTATKVVNDRQDRALMTLDATKADASEVDEIQKDLREVRSNTTEILKILIEQK